MCQVLVRGIMASLMAAAFLAGATTIFYVVDAPVTQIPLSTTFVAPGPTAVLTFGGYQLPSFEQAIRISVTVLFSSTTNLLHTMWQFTAGSIGSQASQSSDGSGVNGIKFGNTVMGSYDLFSRSFATVAGQTYALNFFFTQDYAGPNGLRITVNERFATLLPQLAVRESATKTMICANGKQFQPSQAEPDHCAVGGVVLPTANCRI